MIRIAFVAFAAVHGLIHLMGLVKAFRLAEVSQLSASISKPAWILWLLAGVAYLASAAVFAFGIRLWWVLGAVALVLSQILILSAWGDAKAGTIANVIVLAAVVLGYATWRFDSVSRTELRALLGAAIPKGEVVTEQRLASLPPVVQTWLRSAKVVGKESASTVHLAQKGSMRTSPQGSWMPFEAEQWFTCGNPAFLWLADVSAGPGLSIAGRDTYRDGRGHMVIKLLSLVSVADASGKEIDQGAMIRFLAEMCWFPSSALSDFVRWEQVDSLGAKAVIEYGGITGSGLFTFNERGEVLRFEAKRYYDRSGASTLEDWLVEMGPDGYREFSGARIPAKASVSWKIDGGLYNWLTLEITDLAYDPHVP